MLGAGVAGAALAPVPLAAVVTVVTVVTVVEASEAGDASAVEEAVSVEVDDAVAVLVVVVVVLVVVVSGVVLLGVVHADCCRVSIRSFGSRRFPHGHLRFGLSHRSSTRVRSSCPPHSEPSALVLFHADHV